MIKTNQHLNLSLLESYEPFKIKISNYKSEFSNLWWNTSQNFNLDRKTYSFKEKIFNEHKINTFLDELFSMLKDCPAENTEINSWKESLWKKIQTFGKEIGFLDDEISSSFSDNLLPITSKFIKDSKDFDKDIKLCDVFQALRNVWIVNLIQWIVNDSVSYSNSIFAYSMLYPYTDNFLDDPNISKSRKKEINDAFNKILYCTPNDLTQDNYVQGFSNLISMIRVEHPIYEYPDVSHSLISIHNAQCKATSVQSDSFPPYSSDILSVSIDKGGTSVLADAYIIYGTVSETLCKFAYGYGVLLQFCDDLQDTLKDSETNSMTIFSQLHSKWDLDIITNKLFNYIDEVLSYNSDFISNSSINPFVKKNIEFLILEAIAQNNKDYSKEYIKKITPYFPFRLRYLKKLYKKLSKKYERFQSNSGESLEDILIKL